MTRAPDPDYYAVLEVAPTARQRVIDAAYRKLIEEYHPDTHPNDPEALAHTKLINEAHAVLTDPERRRAYDAGRRTESSGGGGPQGPGAGSREHSSPPPRPADGSGPARRGTPSPDLPLLVVRPERVDCQAGSLDAHVRFSIFVEQAGGPPFDPLRHHIDIVPSAPWRNEMFTKVTPSRAQLPLSLEFEMDTSSLAPDQTYRGPVDVVARPLR
jgi:curved DNA-binding protein CbpA